MSMQIKCKNIENVAMHFAAGYNDLDVMYINKLQIKICNTYMLLR